MAKSPATSAAPTPDYSDLMALATASATAIPAAYGIASAAPSAATAATKPEGVRYAGGPPLSLVIGYVAPNTKRGKSAARYAKYPAVPFTLAEALKVEGGPVRGDFIWDLERGLIKPAT